MWKNTVVLEVVGAFGLETAPSDDVGLGGMGEVGTRDVTSHAVHVRTVRRRARDRSLQVRRRVHPAKLEIETREDL